MNQNAPSGMHAVAQPDDFSLVVGGPLFQLWRGAHLSGDSLELLGRRILIMSLLAWLPLLALSALEGHLWGGSVKLPFLEDVDTHARFLLALPLFILAEVMVHQILRTIVRQFAARGLVLDAARKRFDGAVAAALRWRNSVGAETLLLAFVYGFGVQVIWRNHAFINTASWRGIIVDGKLQPSLAGWWFGCVSLPLVQFILFRWYFRLFIWARFLWHVSRIKLRLVPTHPDHAAGLGFLSMVAYAFAPLLAGHGVLFAGVMANKIFFAGAKLPDFKLEILTLLAAIIFIVLGPLLVFAPQLALAKQTGLFEFGALAQDYVRKFDQKWLRGEAPAGEPLLGSADLQSLADLSNSFAIVRGMTPMPFTKATMLQLVAITLLPFAPLVLTMIPLADLLERLWKALF